MGKSIVSCKFPLKPIQSTKFLQHPMGGRIHPGDVQITVVAGTHSSVHQTALVAMPPASRPSEQEQSGRLVLCQKIPHGGNTVEQIPKAILLKLRSNAMVISQEGLRVSFQFVVYVSQHGNVLKK